MEKVGKEDALPVTLQQAWVLVFLVWGKGKATLNMVRHVHVWAILFRFHVGFPNAVWLRDGRT